MRDATGNSVRGMFNSYAIDHIIGESAWAQRIRKRVLQVSAYDYNVLVSGPSGTGKELVARAVHAHSSRALKPFIPVDCATIPSGLFASQLFGHVKGAFTGAAHASIGCFRAAEGGTLFLDEIGELNPDLQSQLLRVLQERQVVPVGGHQPIPVNVRVVAATHRDLQKEVQAGRFRLDLYYRLNVVRMETEPLSQRIDDIGVLADHFLAKAAVDNGLPMKRMSRSALSVLESHDWPGNVRELEHTIERAMVFHEGATLDQHSFEDLLTAKTAPQADPLWMDTPPQQLQQREITQQQVPKGDVARRDNAHSQPHGSLPYYAAPDVEPASPARGSSRQVAEDVVPAVAEQTDGDVTRLESWPTLDELEAEHIRRTLKETFYNQSAAARLLGIDRKQLARKIKKYALRVPRLSPGRPSGC
ncbi:MAG: sigma-54 dependent transcriptional regulator [Planctomycetia bacterium]|nr:sigma-54 dependent transcriptional regulator [Planctomycetia bacterium]